MVVALAGGVVAAYADLAEEVYIAMVFGFGWAAFFGLGRCYGSWGGL